MVIYVNSKNILNNLFGENFNKYSYLNIIYLYKKKNSLNKFLLDIKKHKKLTFFQIFNTEDTLIEEINLNTNLIIEDSISFYDTLNLFNNNEVRKINNIIKFSLSI